MRAAASTRGAAGPRTSSGSTRRPAPPSRGWCRPTVSTSPFACRRAPDVRGGSRARWRVGVHPAHRRPARRASDRPGGQPRERRRSRRRRAADRHPLRAAPPRARRPSRGRASSRSRWCSTTRVPSVAVTAPEGHLRDAVRVAVAARDAGGGVFERTLELDGRLVAGARSATTVTASLGAQRHVTQRVPSARRDGRREGRHARGRRRSAHAARARGGRRGQRPNGRGTDHRRQPAAASGRRHAGRRSRQRAERSPGWLQRRGRHVRLPLGALRRGRLRWDRRCDPSTYRVRSRDAGRRLRAVVRGRPTVAEACVSRCFRAERSGSRRGPAHRLTAWFEHGHPRLRRATVTWPARVRIGGRLTDLRGRPLAVRRCGYSSGSPVGAGDRPPASARGATAAERLDAGRPVARGPARPRWRCGDAAARGPSGGRVRIRRFGPLTVLSGSVRGGHVPRGAAGAAPVPRARRWRTRALLRTDGLGRFTAFGRVPAGARLRVVVPAQRGYPYARGVGRP